MLNVAYICRYQGRFPEAKASMNMAVEFDPDNSADALVGLARLEMQSSKDSSAKERAEVLYRQSLEKDPSNGE